jgi:hypothetical protein
MLHDLPLITTIVAALGVAFVFGRPRHSDAEVEYLAGLGAGQVIMGEREIARHGGVSGSAPNG